MQIDIDKLIKSSNMIRRELLKHRSYSYIKNNINELDLVNKALIPLTGYCVIEDGIIIDQNSYEEKIRKNNCKLLTDYYDEFESNRNILSPMFSNYLKTLSDVNFYYFPFFDKTKVYDEKTFKDIILSFYRSIGTEEEKIAREVIENNRIQLGVKQADDYGGELLGLGLTNESYIIISCNKYNTESLLSIVHEIAHIIERRNIIFSQRKKVDLCKEYTLEIPSCFYELLFMEYLIDNCIDVKGAQIRLNDRLELLKSCAYDILKVQEYNNGYITPSCDVIVEDEEGNNRLIYLRESYFYGIGYYLGLHLLELFSNDKKNFHKMFNDMICLRNERTFEEQINSMGLSIDEFTSCEMIKPRILKRTNEINKRYNINI